MPQDNKSVIIDISNIDPKDIQDSESVIQDEALGELIEILKEDSKKIIKKDDPIYKNRVHNTIFINGKRGSGKTQLLLSIKYKMKKEFENSHRFKIYDPIDPTLLYENESFLTIIMAKILNNLEKSSHHLYQKSIYEDNLFRMLSDLSDAIDGIINEGYKDKSSLENISQDQTSLRLEEYLHEFFGYVAHILDKDRLVLLIDDVDMAFDKGFEVLEVVRKYLSSPFIIPIITGELKLYETIVENNFIQKIDGSLKSDYIDRNRQISKDYLLKVLPGHRRIDIKTLDNISQTNMILFMDRQRDKIYYVNRNSDTKRKIKRYIDESLKKEGKESKSKEYIDFLDTIENGFLTNELAQELMTNLLSNPLRNIVQFLHKEYSNIQHDPKISMNFIEKFETTYNLRLNISNWRLFYLGGLEYFSSKNYKYAIESFEESLKLVKRGEIYFALGNTRVAMKERDEAKSNYKKAIELGYKVAESHYNIGEIHYLEKEYTKAKDRYIESIKYNCTNCTVYNRLGACYLIIGVDGKRALENFDRAIECDPDDHKAYINKIETAFIINRPIADPNFIKDFEDRFLDNKKVSKAYEMFQLLKDIINRDLEEIQPTIEKQFEEWKDKYRDTSYKEWNFEALDKYAKNIRNTKKREMFEKYLNIFKEAM